jgi:hypothetical protein
MDPVIIIAEHAMLINDFTAFLEKRRKAVACFCLICYNSLYKWDSIFSGSESQGGKRNE